MPVAHIGHAELRVTDIERSRWFFTEVMGLYITEEDDEHVHLRAWQDWDHHTLTITRADTNGLEHVGWRVEAPEELARLEKRLKELGTDYHWIEGGTEPGQGDGLRFMTPQGVPIELYWEVTPFLNRDPDMDSVLPSHPQRFTGKGMSPRRFDHVNFLVDDVKGAQEWLSEVLGIHHRYFLENSAGDRLGSWLSRTNLSHEIAFMRNRNQDGNFIHHVGYYVESPTELVRAATIIADAGLKLEWGPGCHGTSGAIFLYCFEPSGNRIEVWTGGFLLFAPDWKPIRWDPDNASTGLELWGSGMPESYLTYGTPSGFTTAAASASVAVPK